MWNLKPRGTKNSNTSKSKDYMLSKKKLPFPHIESIRGWLNSCKNGFLTSDLFQKDICTSYNPSKLEDNVFVVDPLCIDYDPTKMLSDKDLYRPVKL